MRRRAAAATSRRPGRRRSAAARPAAPTAPSRGLTGHAERAERYAFHRRQEGPDARQRPADERRATTRPQNIAQARGLIERRGRRRPAGPARAAGNVDLPRRRPRGEVRRGRGTAARAAATRPAARPTSSCAASPATRASSCTAARSASARGERLFNTTRGVRPATGSEIARYRKIHLFDIVTPDGTGYRESATFGAGERGRDLHGRRRDGRAAPSATTCASRSCSWRCAGPGRS